MLTRSSPVALPWWFAQWAASRTRALGAPSAKRRASQVRPNLIPFKTCPVLVNTLDRIVQCACIFKWHDTSVSSWCISILTKFWPLHKYARTNKVMPDTLYPGLGLLQVPWLWSFMRRLQASSRNASRTHSAGCTLLPSVMATRNPCMFSLSPSCQWKGACSRLPPFSVLNIVSNLDRVHRIKADHLIGMYRIHCSLAE